MDKNIHKILTLLDDCSDKWIFWDESIFNDLNIDSSLSKRLFNIMDSKHYINTLGMSDPYSVMISDEGRNYLYSSSFTDNKMHESKTINITGSNNQVNQDSSLSQNNQTKKVASNNSTTKKMVIGIIVAVIAGLILYYLTKK